MALYRHMLRDEPGVHVPEVVPSHSTDRLLTMTWLAGEPLLNWKTHSQEDKDRLAINMFRAWYVPFYHYGVIHGDPHLGNYTVRPDGSVNLMDFGCVRIFPPRFVRGSIELYRALMTDDQDRAVAAYEDWGFAGLTREMIAVLNRWAAFLYGPLMDDRPRRLTEGMVEGHGREMAQNVFGELRRMGGVRPPREFVFMDRAAIGLGAVFIHLRASINWHRLFESLIEDFDVDALARARQAGLAASSRQAGRWPVRGHPRDAARRAGSARRLVPRQSRAGRLSTWCRPRHRSPRRWRPREIVGSDSSTRALVHDGSIDAQRHRTAIVHCRGALTSREATGVGLETRTTTIPSEFVAVNVQGTLNLLEEAVAPGSKVDRFVFTSTTSLMISQKIRDGGRAAPKEAIWIDETMAPLEPRNIYGVTKLAAEELCRLFHQLHKLPILILRTSRFFPRGGRHGARHRPVGREHQGQRVPVPPAHGRGRRRSPCRGAGQGKGDRLRHLHHLGDDAVLAGRLPRADRRRAVGRGALLPGLSREIRQARLDDVRLDRPRL